MYFLVVCCLKKSFVYYFLFIVNNYFEPNYISYLIFSCHARFTVPLSWRHLSEAWQPVPNLFRYRTLVQYNIVRHCDPALGGTKQSPVVQFRGVMLYQEIASFLAMTRRITERTRVRRNSRLIFILLPGSSLPFVFTFLIFNYTFFIYHFHSSLLSISCLLHHRFRLLFICSGFISFFNCCWRCFLYDFLFCVIRF